MEISIVQIEVSYLTVMGSCIPGGTSRIFGQDASICAHTTTIKITLWGMRTQWNAQVARTGRGQLQRIRNIEGRISSTSKRNRN